MAPDLNSLPASPYVDRSPLPLSQPTSTAASRRTSQIMGPPPVPASATPTTSRPAYSQHRNSIVSSNEQSGVPLRHPRPLTAAELCLECEKEQEAVVNRLTRELSALRAQSASVASNASVSSTSTSASLLPIDISDPNPTHQLIGATHPTPSRRHRSSSASTRSLPAPLSTASLSASHAATVPIGGVSQASADRAAAAGGSSMGRQNSASASGTSTPARQSFDITRQPNSTSNMHVTLPQRPTIHRDISQAAVSTASSQATAGTSLPTSIPSPALSPLHATGAGVTIPPTQHFVDVTAYRHEMETVKAENEALRQRVRALERALRARRRDSSQSDASTRPDVLSNGNTIRQPRDSSESGFGRISVNVPIGLPSPSPSPHGFGVAAWAASNNGGVGGVAGPRERSESQSTTASSRRGIVGITDEDVRVGESASSMASGRGF